MRFRYILLDIKLPDTTFLFFFLFKVTLRLTVSQSCLGVEPKYGTFDQSFLLFVLKDTVLSFIGAPSLTKGRVCCVSVLVVEVYSS
jgi:hypothetical protein